MVHSICIYVILLVFIFSFYLCYCLLITKICPLIGHDWIDILLNGKS